MKEISPIELRERLAQSDIGLLDVREPEEFALVHIQPCELIPLMDLPNRLSEVEALSLKHSTVAVICRSGKRSEMAIDWLEANGLSNLVNVRGGINAYAKEADTSLSPY